MIDPKVKMPGKPLSSAWHSIVAESGISADPALSVGMHGMFMSGAAVVLRIIMEAPEESEEAVAQAVIDELNEWQDRVKALMVATKGRPN